MRNPFFRINLDSNIPRSLEKPPKLGNYNSTKDLDKHVDHVETMLDHHHPCGVVKCKIFTPTVKRAAMMWFNTSPNGCINSRKELYDSFTYQFISRKWKLTIIVVLSWIKQRKKENF